VEGDTFFPIADMDSWRLVEVEHHAADAVNDFPFSFEVYE
jgi:hypothetical protein